MKKFKIGLQLYSVNGYIKDNLEEGLKAVKEIGYDYVELAGYYGKEAQELRALLDKYGLQAISAHESRLSILEKTDYTISMLKATGAKYCAIAYIGPDDHKGGENYEKTVSDMKKIKKLLQDNGITLLYHNHDHEFQRYDGKFKLEWLIDDVGIYPELDVCWTHYAGYNPSEYILNFKDRLPVLHLKDFACTKMPDGVVYTDEQTDMPKYPDKNSTGFEFRPVGHGVQEVEAILKSAEAVGTEYVIVEQDLFVGMTPLEGVKMSRDYLKSLGL